MTCRYGELAKKPKPTNFPHKYFLSTATTLFFLPDGDQCMPHDTNATLVVSCWSRNWISSRRGFHEMGEADDFFTALCTRNSVALFFFVSICQAFFWGTVQRWYDRKP